MGIYESSGCHKRRAGQDSAEQRIENPGVTASIPVEVDFTNSGPAATGLKTTTTYRELSEGDR
jgi:hypothetical protein